MAITNFAMCFLPRAKDSALGVWGVILVGGINGIPMGAKFLSDALLADTIDYDEFLSGQRNEATYTCVASAGLVR